MIQEDESRDRQSRQETLLPLLDFALTGDHEIAKRARTILCPPDPNAEQKNLSRFLRLSIHEMSGVEPIEMIKLLAMLIDRRGRFPEAGIIKRGIGHFFIFVCRPLLRIVRNRSADDVLTVMQFHTFRELSIPFLAEGKGYRLNLLGNIKPIASIKYSTYLKIKLQTIFPKQILEIDVSYAIRHSQLLLALNKRKNARRQINGALKKIEKLPDSELGHYLKMQAYHHAGHLSEGPNDALSLFWEAQTAMCQLPISPQIATLAHYNHSGIGDALRELGRTRDAIYCYEHGLSEMRRKSTLWTSAQFAGQFIQSALNLGELYIALSNFPRACSLFEEAQTHLEKLNEGIGASGLPHNSLLFYIQYHLDMLRVPIEDAPAILDKYIDSIEAKLSESDVEAAKTEILKTWWSSMQKLPSDTSYHQATLDSGRKALGMVNQADYFQKYSQLLKRLRDTKTIFLAYKASDVTDSDSILLENINIGTNNNSALLFLWEIKGSLSRKSADSEIKIRNLKFPYDKLAESAVRIKRAQKECASVAEPINLINITIKECATYIPMESIYVTQMALNELEGEKLHFDVEILDSITALLETIEVAALNYGHPEDVYLIRSKIGIIYERSATLVLKRWHCLEKTGVCQNRLYDQISVWTDRGALTHSVKTITEGDFSTEELEHDAVKTLLSASRALREARDINICIGVSDEDYEERSTRIAAVRFGEVGSSVDLESVSDQTSQEISKILNSYEQALTDVKTRVRDLPSHELWTRQFRSFPTPGTLRIHFFVAGSQICCVAYSVSGIAGSRMSEIESRRILERLGIFSCPKLDDQDFREIVTLTDAACKNINWADVRTIQLTIQSPLEIIPWSMIARHCGTVLSEIPYSFDLAVGFSDSNLVKTDKALAGFTVIGPPFERSDLPFASLECLSIKRRHCDVGSLWLPDDVGEISIRARTCGVFLITGHVMFNETAPSNSAIVGKKSDSAGVSLGMLHNIPGDFKGCLIILNTCHSGGSGRKYEDDLTRRISPEMRYENARAASPKAFAAAFFSGGAAAVVATLWKVDDLAAFLFGYKYTDLLKSTPRPWNLPALLKISTNWLCNLSSGEAIALVEAEVSAAPQEHIPKYLLDKIESEISRLRAGSERPFEDPRYWAAYVVYGVNEL